ncbi:MAG: hypothetical protein FWB97_10880 [Oscillospiraceae bacterium]|nr:hypothetical protein [Oscillospiraceae bacterium]
MDLHSSRLSRTHFPVPKNNAPASGETGTQTAQYVTNIRSAADEISGVLRGLTGRSAADSVEEAAQRGEDAAQARSSRTVPLGDGLTATVSTDSANNATIPNLSHSTNSVMRLVMSYNSMLSEVARRSDDHGSQKLQIRMGNISSTFARSLANLGIGIDSGGRMAVDQGGLEAAAESGSLEQFFIQSEGSNYSFTGQLGRVARDVSRNPSNFVSGREYGFSFSDNFQYTNRGEMVQYNFLTPGSILDFML